MAVSLSKVNNFIAATAAIHSENFTETLPQLFAAIHQQTNKRPDITA